MQSARTSISLTKRGVFFERLIETRPHMKKIRLGSWFFAGLALAIGAVGQTAPSNVGVPSTALPPESNR